MDFTTSRLKTVKPTAPVMISHQAQAMALAVLTAKEAA